MKQHVPVMINEVLCAASECDMNVMVDATLGLAGHASAVLEKFGQTYLYGFDQDSAARKIASDRLAPFAGRSTIIPENFRNIACLAERESFPGADFILFDLGVSNMQITEADRGFSFQVDGPLDMRMNFDAGRRTAANLLSSADIRELTHIFRDYGEERYAYEIARGIVRAREHGRGVKTTFELVELIREILPEPVQRKMGTHPARRVFQALRIAVNDELRALEEALDGAYSVLKENGRIAVISYHSLEDRITKKYFSEWEKADRGKMTPRKPMLPAETEIENNYKSRSAKMRVFNKITSNKRNNNSLRLIFG